LGTPYAGRDAATFFRFDHFNDSDKEMPMDDAADDETIRKRAHQIGEKDGRPRGKHDDHQRRAASEVHGLEDLPKADSAKKASTKPKASTGQSPRISKSAT
jgi:hypothetical protein